MTVYLAMRGKYTCNNTSNNSSSSNNNNSTSILSTSSSSSSTSSSMKSNLINNYISMNSNKDINNSLNCQRIVSIILLDSTCLDFNYDNKTTVNELFEKVCNKLQLKETDVFGLAQKTKDEFYFLPASEKLYKYSSTPKFSSNAKVPSSSSLSILSTASSLASLNTSQLSATEVDNESSFKLYFRVQFYLTDPLLLRDSESRQLYYLQLKENFLTINHNISQEKYFTLAALALQADFGNFNHEIHKGNYFDINEYFPKWIINKLGENFIMKNIPSLHAEQSRYNYNKKSAQIKYCAQLSNNEDSPYNLHLYNVCKTKDEINASLCLGIAPKGILVFEIRHNCYSEISLISTFPWSSVTKLNCDKKKFEITISIDSKSRRYSYFTNCEKKSKYLFELSKITHSFTVNIFSRLADQKTLANYVTESYKETMFMINDNSFFENYQEREICVPSQTTIKNKMTIATKPVEDEEQKIIPVIAKSTDYDNDDKLSSTNSLSSTQTRLSSVNSNDSTSGIISDDSSRDSRQNRKRLAQFSNDNIDCSELLLRKYSSLSCNPKFENYIQQHQQQQQQQHNRYTTDSINDTNNNNTLTTNSNSNNNNNKNTVGSPSTTSSSSSMSSSSLAHSQTMLCDGVPVKIKKSSVQHPHLHTAQSCYSNLPSYYQQQQQQAQQQQQQQQQQHFLLPNTPYNNNNNNNNNNSHHHHHHHHGHGSNGLDYRQTFSATTQTTRIKSTPPPPYLINTSATTTPAGTQIIRGLQQQQQQMNNNFTLLQHYSDSNLNETQFDSLFNNRNLLSTSSNTNGIIVPPYVEYKKPPSYQESVQRIKHSKDSSMSSIYNEQSSSSTCTSPVNIDDYENSTLNSNTNSDTFKNYDTKAKNNESQSMKQKQKQSNDNNNVDNDDETEKLNQSINKITIDEKNLEQIRMKAASMSLPLLTALCSDKSLIRCLSKRDETNNNKQVS